VDGTAWLEDVCRSYRDHKDKCERAVAQVTPGALFQAPYSGGPSLAVLMKHLGGNLRSRWRDFLTTDGEKEDRRRDLEFDVSKDTPGSIRASWDDGWQITLSTLEALEPVDLERTVTIRSEPWKVVDAIHRNLTHTAYHTGQVVMLARHHAKESWTMLSIPPGGSEAFNETMRDRHGRT
jgi:uncharacterized damage-inducible protein DinB